MLWQWIEIIWWKKRRTLNLAMIETPRLPIELGTAGALSRQVSFCGRGRLPRMRIMIMIMNECPFAVRSGCASD